MAHEPISLGSIQTNVRDFSPFTVAHIRFPPGAVLETHTHERPVFAISLRGTLDNRILRQTLDLDRASVWTEPAGEPHENRVGTAGAEVLAILPDPEADGVVELCGRLIDDVRAFRHAGVRILARRMIGELGAHGPGAQLALQGLAFEALAVGLRDADALGRHRESPRWLTSARDLVHDRFQAPLDLREIADAVGVEPARLARAFRRRFGKGLGAYQRDLRLEWAAEELVRGETPIGRIALQAGFYDQSHFTRHFRRRMGQSPGRYRETHTGGRTRP